MRATRIVAGLMTALLAGSLAAQAPAPPDNQTARNEALSALGIDPRSMRPGVDGDDKADSPNPGNFDEAKIRPFTLPALMGDKPPIDAAGWAERRAQIARLVEDEMVGRIPEAAASVRIDWTLLKSEKKELDGIKAQVRTMRGATAMPDGRKGPVIEIEITAPEKPVGRTPAVIEYTFVFPANFPRPANATPPASPAVAALKRGWTYVAYYPYSVQADNGAGLRQGIIGLVSGGALRGPTDWGVLRAWGWGASRVADLLQADPAIDAGHLALSGMSRFGKSSLVAAAFDPRFTASLISSPGAGGAKLMRRNFGEQPTNMAGPSAYHWYTPAFLRYGGPRDIGDWPIDAHMLVALVAPRPLFIATGRADKGDGWVDPRGTYLALLAASPAWRLLGSTGPTSDRMPPVLASPAATTLTWYQHDQGHAATPNWEPFLDWANAQWGRTPK
jgi:hypothetical protein